MKPHKKTIRLNGDTYKILLTENQIQSRIQELAKKISRDYKGKNPVALCILNGAFFFFADLLREAAVDFEVAFVTLSSYANKKQSSGSVKMMGLLPTTLMGRH